MTPRQIMQSRLYAAGIGAPGATTGVLANSPSAAAILGAATAYGPPVNPAAVLPPGEPFAMPVAVGGSTREARIKLAIGLGLGGAALLVLLLSRRSS